jgi:hypothetical protein
MFTSDKDAEEFYVAVGAQTGQTLVNCAYLNLSLSVPGAEVRTYPEIAVDFLNFSCSLIY